MDESKKMKVKEAEDDIYTNYEDREKKKRKKNDTSPVVLKPLTEKQIEKITGWKTGKKK